MRKNILFIYGPLNGGGAEIVLLEVLRNFDYTKYNVNLLLTVSGGLLYDRIPSEVNVYALWDSYSLGYKVACRASKWFKFNYLIKRKYKELMLPKQDVAISFLEGSPLRFHNIINPSGRNITWVHCDLYKKHYTRDVFRAGEELEAYNKMDEIVNVSQYSEIAFLKRFPNITSSLNVVYNPIDIDRIRSKALSSDTIINSNIVIVGRLTEVKRVDRAIRVIHKFKTNGYNITLRVVGDGELRGELEKLSEDLGVSDLVIFEGYQNNPYKFINKADILLSTSDYEGFGLVICEAMALGVPVVSTKTAGPMELLSDNKYGILCDFEDDAIYSSIKELIDDKQLYTYYSEQGSVRVTDFSVTNAINQIYKLLK